jgi:hypothetical protein
MRGIMNRIIIRLIVIAVLGFSLSGCGVLFGRGWGCGGPGYYQESSILELKTISGSSIDLRV